MLICEFRRLVDDGLAWVTPFFSLFFGGGRGGGCVCGFYDQRQTRMVVTGLEGAAGFSVSLGMKNSYGQRGYIQTVGAGLGLFKISWGKNLKGTIIFGWLALLMVLLSNGCLRLCCIDRKSALIPKPT